MATFKSATVLPFNTLVMLYKKEGIFEGNFWFAGNALHTVVDHFLVTNQKDTDGFLKTAHKIYTNLSAKGGWWVDDYSWWGNAFMLAINNRSQLGYGDTTNDSFFQELLTDAQTCWSKINAHWRNTAYNATENDNSAGNSSTITGGTYNNQPDGDDPPMSGRNSVTNEGFWMLSSSLNQYFNNKDSRYSDKAAAEQQWFKEWLGIPGGILNSDGFVLERPLGNATDPAWYWTGDQGLFMNACQDHIRATQIAKLVIQKRVDGDGVLHEYLGFMNAERLRQFEGDYATGKGIFMRNLAILNVNTPGQPYTNFIKKNAAALIRNLGVGSQFSYNWNFDRYPDYEGRYLSSKGDPLDKLIMQACGIDALSAAIRFSSDDEQI